MIEAYFSHSWRPEDVQLNVLVWNVIAEYSVLYIDYEGNDNKTYYINRLEELIRKSEVFVSVLAYRDDDGQENNQKPDYKLKCSPAALFELRLAERARKPRWIIYDDRTGFRPMSRGGEQVVYTPIDTVEELARDGRNILSDGEGWIKNICQKSNTIGGNRSRQAALLIDYTRNDAAEVVAKTQQALLDAGYEKVRNININHTDAEVITILQSSGLLVAEIGEQSSLDIYGMAHALFIPSIRFIRDEILINSLPRSLEGHPGGYQHDLILADDNNALASEVRKRAEAMRDRRKPIEGFKAGCAYFRRKRYRPHNVFFSHNISAEDSDLLKEVFDKLDSYGVRAWEYRNNNKAGVVWEDELQSALEDATDVVFILDQDFELSGPCTDELKTILGRRDQINSIIPFLWGQRTRPNPELSKQHHEKLPRSKKHAAQIITDRLLSELSV